MEFIPNRPLVKKAIIFERPYSARFMSSHRTTRSSFHRIQNTSLFHSNKFQLQDMGTSTSPLKIEDHDSNAVPIQNFSFNMTKGNEKKRKRRVVVIKYLKSEVINSNRDTIKSSKNSNRSMLKFFDIVKHEEKNIPPKNHEIRSRPRTGKGEGPVTKRALSEIYFENLGRNQLFDISEVLSVANGTINMRNIKVQR